MVTHKSSSVRDLLVDPEVGVARCDVDKPSRAVSGDFVARANVSRETFLHHTVSDRGSLRRLLNLVVGYVEGASYPQRCSHRSSRCSGAVADQTRSQVCRII